ncbi:MAG: methyl-accepting chemotaxis protein [Acidimicrobiales bacterium]
MASNIRSGRYVRWFLDRGLSTKLMTAVGVVAAAAVIVGAVGITKLGVLADHNRAMYEEEYLQTTTLTGLRRQMLLVRLDAVNHGASTDADTMARYESMLEEDDTKMQQLRQAVEQLDLSAGPRAEVDAALAEWDAYLPLRDEMVRLAAAGDDAAWEVARNNAATHTEPAEQRLQAAVDAIKEEAAAQAEADAATAGSARTTVLLVLLIGLAAGVGVALFVSRLIVRPVKAVAAALDRAADGDLTAEVDVAAADEVGAMAASMRTMLERTRGAMQSIAAAAHQLSASSEELSATATQVGAAAEETSAQSMAVASAAEQVSANVATVAAGTEQMTASIKEIARSTSEASQVANDALRSTATINAAIGRLGDSSVQIGEVVSVITSIAEQTNLLALNATIEAARAGEAGRGFAVVASEVKDLAHDTARATEEIARRIQGIQSDTTEAVDAAGQIGDIVGRVNELQATIASAVEEQSATTDEISRTVIEASAGTSEIAGNITQVATASRDAAQGATNSLDAARDLAQMAAGLQDLIAQFRFAPTRV